ncbi:MAG TPA: MGMT family protein, partial [Actinomycetota bacterium]|nr:MGMT family protein [Actinomycetota bacterium]
AIPVSQPGTELQLAFWDAMRRVPPGKTISYRELAESAGRPRAIRAAGTTCGKNRVAPFVPCHRIVRTGGDVGNYGYGVDSKRWLLEHEANHA